jgi:vitamin K-dependent gamma-carboxylase
MKNRKKIVEQEQPETSSSCADKFVKYFGFCPSDLKSLKKLTLLLYRPTDASSLCVVRFLFGNFKLHTCSYFFNFVFYVGFLMFFDIPEERGLAIADIRWGDPLECRFPLFNFLPLLPLQWMLLVYLVMWLGKFVFP